MTLSYLLSFFYFKGQDLDELARATGRADLKFFADSGAFSALTTGTPVDIDEYAEWVQRWQHRISVYANLDVHFDWKAGEANQRHLEGLGLRPFPVFHLGEPLDVFRGMVEEYNLVAVGGNVGPRHAGIWGLLDQLHGIAAEHGTGLHGFGIGNWNMIQRFPWASVDSSSPGSSFRYGLVFLFNPYEKRMVKFKSSDAAAWHRWGWLLREYGFDPDEFAGRTRKEQLIPLLRLAGAIWAKVAEAKPETDIYIVDLGFPQLFDGRMRIAHYEDGVQLVAEAAAA